MSTDVTQQGNLKRGLSERHISMIALGGAIGVGLFYGSATTIKLAGPAITLSYLIGGIFIFFIMRALGEMAVAEPVSGSFSTYAYKYIGKFAGFFTGWTYWFMWVVAGMAEITALGVYVNYWFPSVPQWVSALVALVIMTLVNLVNVEAFGEFEFWFAMIKVTAIVVMILIGILIIFGVGDGGHALGFSNLWAHGGFMPNGINGLLFSLVMVAFSFGGVELVGITAGEAANPEKSIPKAINSVIWRILIFYVGALSIMMILFPWNEIGTKGSPFVLIFAKIGIPAAASIINFVVLTAALSSFNSGLFSTGRMLYNLALQNNAPKMFGKLSKSGAPRNGVIVSAALLLLAVFLNYIVPEKVFVYISSVATVAIITSWVMILITQLRFRKAKEREGQSKLAFKLPLYPYSNYITLAFLALVVVLMAIMPDMRVALYVAPVWCLILYVGYKSRRPIGQEQTEESIYPKAAK
jgi:amino acid transporter, AAT family